MAKMSDTSKVKVGSVFSRHSFGEVTEVHPDYFVVKNSDGDVWNVDEDILSEEFSFADQYDSEEKISRTQAIEVLTENAGTAMTIVFRKKPDHKAVAKALADGQGDKTDRAWSNKVKKLMDGEEREMVGHHFGSFDEHRRLQFTEHSKGLRLVDPRTVKSIIVKRVKYVVKK